MRRKKFHYLFVLSAAVAVVAVSSCGKNEEEARKFPSTEEPVAIAPGPQTSIKLANGITVYFREEHSRNEVAVEFVHRAGIIHEDKVHLARMATLMQFYGASESFGPGEAADAVKRVGKINAEVVGDFTHWDYVVPSTQLDLVFKIEAERLGPMKLTEEVLKQQVEKCEADLEQVLNSPFGSLIKYGLMGCNQVLYFGKTFVPVAAGAKDVTITDVRRYRDNFYRPEDMVVVLIGDFDTAQATEIVKRHLEGLPSKPARKFNRTAVDGNRAATWDVDASVIFFVFPGPYSGPKERMLLTMYGSYLMSYFANDPTTARDYKTIYASTYTFPVRDLPFFVYAHPKKGVTLDSVRANILIAMQNIIGGFNESLLEVMKDNTINFVNSSMLDSQMNINTIPHFQLIGQEALNVGLKHLFKDNLSDDEFVDLVNSITFEEATGYLKSRFTRENMREISLEPRRE